MHPVVEEVDNKALCLLSLGSTPGLSTMDAEIRVLTVLRS